MKKGEPFIVKIQRALFSTENPAPTLFYNEDKSVYHSEVMTDKQLKTIMGKNLKAYWYAEIRNKKLQLMHKVKNQRW